MLKRVIKLSLFFFFVYSCTDRQNKFSVAFKNFNDSEYSSIYSMANDSLKTWSLNNLGYYQYLGKSKTGFLDSILCFNKSKTRLVSCLLEQQLLKEGIGDEIDFFYGEKINNKWYFFSGPNIFIPREKVKDHPIHTPLSYQQLHQIALKEVYGGYLKRNGEINESWFTSHFENAGWGKFEDQASDVFLKGKRFNTKKEFFEFIHLQSTRNNWLHRDTTKPIIYLPKKDLVL